MAAGPAPSRAIPSITAAIPDYASDKAKAVKTQIAGLEAVADYCQSNKAFRQRDKTYEALIVLDPDHKVARKWLKYKFDKKKNQWVRKGKYRLPKEGKPEFIEEAIKQREALDEAYVDTVLDLIDEHEEALGPKKRQAELAELLAAAPDNARIREAMGYVGVEEDGKTVWKTVAVVQAEETREELADHLRELRQECPEPEEAEPTSKEEEIDLDWTQILKTSRVRVAGDVEADEILQVTRNAHMAFDLLPELVGKKGKPRKGFTVYLFNGAGSREDFLDAYPGLTDEERDERMNVASHWMPGGLECIVTSEETASRVDLACKQVTQAYLGDTFGKLYKRGWISEGFGLYVNQMVVGTRLSYLVIKSDYDREEDSDRARDIKDPNSDWFEMASEVLTDASPNRLVSTVGKGPNEMEADDYVLSYCLIAYLIEGHGPDVLEDILTVVGKEEMSGVQALEKFLEMPMPEIQKALHGWIDEVGTHDYEYDY